MLLVSCSEAFGYTHDQTLDSSLVLILAMLREHGYLVNERNKALYPDDKGAAGSESEPGEWVEVTDFDTSQKKKVRKMKSI